MTGHDDSPPSQAFPPSARLHTPSEFQAAFTEGRRLHTPSFRLHARQTGAGVARLGVSVSRKVDPRAVVRNRIKRIVRDHFRRAAATLPPGDYVVVAKREAALAVRNDQAATLHAELAQLFERAASLKPLPAPGTIPASATGRPAASSDS